MKIHRSIKKVLSGSIAMALALSIGVAGCSSGEPSDDGGGTLIIGTTDKVATIDPAGSYDNGSYLVQTQVYPQLFSYKIGEVVTSPDIAESGEFTEPNIFTVKLKEGVTFANGHPLTASDVKHTFDRQIAIADENGPSSLLANLESTEVVDELTVAFHLISPDDVTFEQVLASPVGPIIDEEVFPADALITDDEIVAANAFAGPYVIETYKYNELITYTAFDGYKGIYGAPATKNIQAKYYAEASNMKLDIESGAIDVAYRSLSPTDATDLQGKDGVNYIEGSGAELRFIVFNFETQPFGTKTPEADAEKAHAVREAIANVVDRKAIAADVYKDTYQPAYSLVAAGMDGAINTYEEDYGIGGLPDVEKARVILEDAGVETPVAISLQYNGDHYGESSADEYNAVKSQLEASGLFTVTLQQTEWVTYVAARNNTDEGSGEYPLYQLGWFPDLPDADNYLSPFYGKGNFLNNSYVNEVIYPLLATQLSELDQNARRGLLEELQQIVTDDIPILPLLQGKQYAFARDGVTGVEKTLDVTHKFRYGVIAKQ